MSRQCWQHADPDCKFTTFFAQKDSGEPCFAQSSQQTKPFWFCGNPTQTSSSSCRWLTFLKHRCKLAPLSLFKSVSLTICFALCSGSSELSLRLQPSRWSIAVQPNVSWWSSFTSCLDSWQDHTQLAPWYQTCPQSLALNSSFKQPAWLFSSASSHQVGARTYAFYTD